MSESPPPDPWAPSEAEHKTAALHNLDREVGAGATTLTVALSKLPARGMWFEVPGVTVRVEDVRHIGSEVVILGARVSEEERPSTPRAAKGPRLTLTPSGDIPELNVILDVVVASGEWRRLGRRRLTRFRMSPEG